MQCPHPENRRHLLPPISYETDFQITGTETILDPHKSLILFRIAQEVLNNTIKHAKATRISIFLKFTSELFILTLTDNGTGFAMSNSQPKDLSDKGSGLSNMYNRAKLIGADLQIDSHPKTGTKASITLSL